MKVLNALLIVICFSSCAYASDSSNSTDSQKLALFTSMKDRMSVQCFKDFAELTKISMTDELTKSIKENCSCLVDKIAEKAGGIDFYLNNSADTITKKQNDIMQDKDVMTPIFKACGPKGSISIDE